MRWPVRAILFLMLLLGSERGLWAQFTAVAPLYPPLVTSTGGDVADGGLSYEIVLEAARRLGATVHVRIEPFARALASARETGVLIFPLVLTPEREALFEWLGPVNRLDYQLYRLRKASPNKPLSSWKEIGDGAVGVLTNDVVSDQFRALGVKTLVPVAEFEQLIKMLVAGRIQFVASTPPAMDAALKKLDLPPTTVETALDLSGVIPGDYSYLAVAKGTSPRLVADLKRALQQLQEDGTWERLYRKYTF